MPFQKHYSIFFLNIQLYFYNEFIPKSKYLPEFLSEERIAKVKLLDYEADDIISESKIDDVIFYFDKLNDNEKLECIQKLKDRLDGYCV